MPQSAIWGFAIGLASFALLGILYSTGSLEGLDNAARAVADMAGSWKQSHHCDDAEGKLNLSNCMIPFNSGGKGEGSAARANVQGGSLYLYAPPDWSGYASRLGGASAATTITLVTALLLAGLHQWRTSAVALAFALAGGMAVDPLKGLFGGGYPSGHTIGATLQFGLLLMLGTVAWRRSGGPMRPDLGRHALYAWITLAVAVGLDRLFMGVHELSHVLAGWAFGVALACAALIVDQGWNRHSSPRAGAS
jgi:membrane-associated phospholipid phosphatase